MTTRSRLEPGDGDPRHGTVNGYRNLNCHCIECTAVNSRAHFDYMHRDPIRLERHAARERTRRAKKKLAE